MFRQECFSDGLTLKDFNGEELMQMLEEWGFVDKDVRAKFFKKLQEEIPNHEIIHPAPPKNERNRSGGRVRLPPNVSSAGASPSHGVTGHHSS